MQRIAFPTLLTTFFALGPAFAGPLNLNPQAQPAANSAQPGIGAIFASPPPAEPAPTRYAQTEATAAASSRCCSADPAVRRRNATSSRSRNPLR